MHTPSSRHSPAARLAVSLSMATFVFREGHDLPFGPAEPLAETHAKAEVAAKQALVELGLAHKLFVPPQRPEHHIAAHVVAWEEMGLASAVRLPPANHAGRTYALPLGRKVKQLTLPPLGEAVNRILQPGRPPAVPQPSAEGRALASWLGG